MNPDLVASLLAPDPKPTAPQPNAPAQQSNAPAPQPVIPQHPTPSPAPAGNPQYGGPIAPSGQSNPRRPRNRPGMSTPGPNYGPPGPPHGPYGMQPGGPGGLAIDPYGNIVNIGGPDPFNLYQRAPGMMGPPPMGQNFININSNNYYGDVSSGMVINDDMVVINGRDWSRIPPWQWPPHVMDQYQRGMQAGAQGMAEGARALEEAGEMMHNLGLNLGMGPWGMGHPPHMRRRNRRR